MQRLTNGFMTRQRGAFLPPFWLSASNDWNRFIPDMLMLNAPRAARWLLSLLLAIGIAAPVSLVVAEPAQAATHKPTTTHKQTATHKQAGKQKTGKPKVVKHSRQKSSVASTGKRQKKTASGKRQRRHAVAVAAVAATPVVLSAAELEAQARRRGPAHIESAVSLPLDLQSRAALITNARTGEVLYGKNYNQTMPIASITKLMTAMIVLDAGLDLNDPVTIADADVDHLRKTHSRLSVGTTLTRGDLLLIALMASENRAAAALARSYPGGTPAAIAAMNRKARSLGMTHSVFHDSTGLNGDNVSTPGDLVKMVQAAYRYANIRAFSTMPEYQVESRGHVLQYKNTNGLVKKPEWNIEVSKTGFINEAGRCLVMMARVREMPVVIVLMDSVGKYTRIGDANRVKRWLELALRT